MVTSRVPRKTPCKCRLVLHTPAFPVIRHDVQVSVVHTSSSHGVVFQQLGLTAVEDYGHFRYPQRRQFALERAVEMVRLALAPALGYGVVNAMGLPYGDE